MALTSVLNFVNNIPMPGLRDSTQRQFLLKLTGSIYSLIVFGWFFKFCIGGMISFYLLLAGFYSLSDTTVVADYVTAWFLVLKLLFVSMLLQFKRYTMVMFGAEEVP